MKKVLKKIWKKLGFATVAGIFSQCFVNVCILLDIITGVVMPYVDHYKIMGGMALGMAVLGSVFGYIAAVISNNDVNRVYIEPGTLWLAISVNVGIWGLFYVPVIIHYYF